MRYFSRRSMLKTGAAAAAASTMTLPEWLGGTAQASTYVRYEASTPNGQAMLAKYQTAVGKMRGLTKGDPCSWTFQAFTHWIQGPMSFANKPGEVASLPQSQQQLASDMWDTCQNHGGETSEDMFLPWHRLYVLYLERICRNLLGDSMFTLPYWNYNASATAALPGMFLTPASTSNPLWYPYRNSGPQAGGPANAGLNLNCLSVSGYPGFSSAIDGNPHGQLHVNVGNGTQGMGTVPWAAQDPIFWMHHCNIDRLWASWNAGGGANPTASSWTDQVFIFANPGASGCTAVKAKVGDVTSISALGYSYDQLEPVGRVRIRWPFVLTQLNLLLLKGPGPVELSARGAHATLAAPSTLLRNLKTPLLSTRLKGLTGEKRIYLLVDGLMAGAQPGVSYDLYLNPGENALEKREESRRVGTINFFSAVMPGGARKMTRPQFSFDVTDALRGLERGGPLGDKVTVSVVPNGAPAANARAMVGGFSFVEA